MHCADILTNPLEDSLPAVNYIAKGGEYTSFYIISVVKEALTWLG